MMQSLQQWFHDHPVISYFLIFAFTAYIFNNVFRPGKLPILKEVFVYIFMAIGSLILLLLQLDRLPIIQCMVIAALLILIVRLRQVYDKRRKKADEGDRAEGN